MTGPVHVTAEVIGSRKAGAYRQLTLVAPGVAERFRPGTFLAVSVGEALLGRRALWIHRVKASGGYGATLDVVVSPTGPGTRWLAALPVGSRVAVTGPLGRPFALPTDAARCLLVGEGYAVGPAVPARRAAARTRQPGDAGRRRGRRGPPAQRTGGSPVRRHGRRGHRRRRVGAARRCRRRRGARPGATPTSSTPPDRSPLLAAIAAGRRRARRPEPARPRAAADLRHRPVRRVPGAVVGEDGVANTSCAPASTAPSSAATGCSGRRWRDVPVVPVDQPGSARPRG